MEPILSATYSVDGPASKPLVAELYHPERGAKVVATRQKVGDRIHYAWTAKNVPQLVPETAMGFSTERPMLVVTTDPSWQNFAAGQSITCHSEVTLDKLELAPEQYAGLRDALSKLRGYERRIVLLTRA